MPTTMKTLTQILAVLALVVAPALASANEGGLPPANTRMGDVAAMQRGAKLFTNYCLSCHSAKYMRYSRVAADLGIDQKSMEQNLIFTGAKFGETMNVAMTPAQGEAWFGKAPPDLSLTARSRGVDWIYNYLKSFYVDESRPSGWNNTLLPNASMPNVLWELGGSQHAVVEPKEKGKHCEHGEAGESCFVKFETTAPGALTPAQYDEAVRDITTYLQYVGEPAALQRHDLGWMVILFLAAFTLAAYFLKLEFWKDVH